MAKASDAVRALIEEFSVKISAAIRQQTIDQIAGVLGAPMKRGPGRPPKATALLAARTTRAPSAPRSKQLCPVPGCKNPAAPVFGMVCRDHKDVSKTLIKKYRDARKAGKAPKGKTSAPKKAPRARAPKAKASTKTAPKALPAVVPIGAVAKAS